MTKILTIQPASFVDNVVDGHEFYKKPYPFSVDRYGDIQFQDFWQGTVYAAIGFQKDPNNPVIDLHWTTAWDHPEKMIGMYLVTEDSDGQWSTHTTAIESFYSNEDGHA